MPSADDPSVRTDVQAPHPGVGARLWAGATAAIAAVSGIAPHVLHHVGPIAGAALIGGAAGTTLFAVLGLVLSVPFLVRLKRRFGSWRAPVVAVVIFGAVFTFSTLVIGPAIRGDDSSGGVTRTSPTTPSGHDGHH